jgi:hypothetical protein
MHLGRLTASVLTLRGLHKLLPQPTVTLLSAGAPFLPICRLDSTTFPKEWLCTM